MHKPNLILRIISYIFPITVKKLTSTYSGELIISIENGQKVLNTGTVNYSYNSLHRVFKKAFHQSSLDGSKVQQVLLLGLGGGSIVQLLRHEYAILAPIRAIELDPQIIELAINDFNIYQYQPIEIIEADAYRYVCSHQAKYNLICVDVFINENVPVQFLTPGFFEKLLALTEKSGLIYFNVMLSSPLSAHKFNEVYHYLQGQEQISIQKVYFVEVEENNRVLVVKK